MRLLWLPAASCLAGCYAPRVPEGVPCPDQVCPDGQSCVLGSCIIGSGSAMSDAMIDASPPADGEDRSAPLALAGMRWLSPCGGPVSGEPTLCTSSIARQTVTIGGDPAQRFQVTVRVRGVGEIAMYNSGTIPAAPNWYVGGQSADDYHNDVRLTVSSPLTVYHLNNSAVDPGFALSFDYSASFPIDGGATATFEVDPQDTVQLKNVDGAGKPITLPGVSTVPSPYDGQFFQLDVTSVQ